MGSVSRYTVDSGNWLRVKRIFNQSQPFNRCLQISLLIVRSEMYLLQHIAVDQTLNIQTAKQLRHKGLERVGRHIFQTLYIDTNNT
jgi:hypothetical protein